jgi:alpha-beta hydrolase superfamily lysophospholipase
VSEGDVRAVEGFEETPGGRLFFRSWTPAAPRAVLLFVHGLAEHSGRYDHVARHFAPKGYASHAIDLRGHGRSPGPRVHVDSFAPWLDDVAAGLALVRRAHPGLPFVVVGHSQGGLIALLQALRDPDDRLGTIVSSPLLGVAPPSRPNGLLRAATRILMAVAPRLLVPNKVNPAWLSRDPEVGRAYLADPLVSRKVSAGWFGALQEAIARARADAPRWASPLLVLASRGDRIVDAEATARWVAAAPAEHVSSVFWDELRHEIFNETTNADVFAAMERWLDARQGQKTERA